MKALLGNMTKNILLIIGGFLACLTGNFLFGFLIGAVAGVLHCCFGGALNKKGMKGALIASLPIAIVVAILCGVGASFSGGLTSLGGFVITFVVMLLCSFVGNFIGNSKFYQEQTNEAPQRREMEANVQDIAQNNNAPTDIDANKYIEHMRQKRNKSEQPTSDFDEMIDINSATGNDRVYYDAIMELTDKKVVTKRIIDEAYDKLPQEVKEKYKNDPPKVALMSYALARSATRKEELDSPYTKTVKQLSGMKEVSDDAINKAYENIPDSAKADLPTDKQSALMLYASGKTLSSIKNEEEREQAEKDERERREVENYYLAIPAGQKAWLPADHALAVAMFKRGEFLGFYDTLPEEYKQVPEFVYKSLCANPESQDPNAWMLYNRDYLMSQFDLALPYPLNIIPLCVLAECVPPSLRFGKKDKELVNEMKDSLIEMFSAELPEPLVRVPVKALWLTLAPKNRMHANTKIKDIKLNIEEVTNNFQVDNKYGEPMRLLLPNSLRDVPLSQLAAKVHSRSIGTTSPMFDIINNVDKLLATEADLPTGDTQNSELLQLFSPSTARYILEWSLDITDDSLNDEEYCEKYSAMEDKAFDKSLPSPLCNIPLLMFRYLLPNLDILNDTTKTEIAIIDDYVAEHAADFKRMFAPTGGKSDFVPKCALNAWTIEQITDEVKYEVPNDCYDEVWRAWMPPDMRNVSYEDIDAICSDLSTAPNPEQKILFNTETIANVIRYKDR